MEEGNLAGPGADQLADGAEHPFGGVGGGDWEEYG
jgi:hypothetical protein